MGAVVSFLTRTAFISAVWFAQCFAVYHLYNTRLPDSVRFAIPALLGLVLFFFALRIPLPKRPRTSLTISMLFAMLLGFCSFWMGMFIALNTFGS